MIGRKKTTVRQKAPSKRSQRGQSNSRFDAHVELSKIFFPCGVSKIISALGKVISAVFYGIFCGFSATSFRSDIEPP